MSVKDQVLELVNKFKKENYLKDKTDAMGDGLLLGANLADEANERSKEAAETTSSVQEKYKEQILAHDLNPNKDPELIDLRNGSDTAGERVNKFENATIIRLTETSDILSKNKFSRPKAGINAYWGDFGSDGNPVWVGTKEQIKGNLDQFKDLIDEIAIVVHLTYRTATNDFIVIEDIDNIKYGIAYGRSIGIETTAIKIHCHISESVLTNYGKSTFWQFYTNKVSELCDEFSSFNINHFVAFNELNFLYKESSIHQEEVKNVLNIVKSKGYKVLITAAGPWDFRSLSHEIIQMLDAVSINLYTSLSNKMERTTLGDVIGAWNSYIPFFEYAKKLKKPIIVSEYGCVDNWQSLNATGGWSFDEAYKSNGEAPYLCYHGFLESEIMQYIDSAWIWFYQDIPNQIKTVQTFRSFKGGNF